MNNHNILYSERFPRSNKYDPAWIVKNGWGHHPLWMAEFLTSAFDLKPGMRVLDLGCGYGVTSVFLAREFGVRVYAADLYFSPDDMWNNAKEYGVEDLIIPIQADARKLPFAKGFFDAVICVDSYCYYGKDDSFLGDVIRFLRPGGQIGMVVPGFMKDTANGVPAHVEAVYRDQLQMLETLSWWKNLWEKDGLVSIDAADTLDDGYALLIRWNEALPILDKERYGAEAVKEHIKTVAEHLKKDSGEYIGNIRLVAAKTEGE